MFLLSTNTNAQAVEKGKLEISFVNYTTSPYQLLYTIVDTSTEYLIFMKELTVYSYLGNETVFTHSLPVGKYRVYVGETMDGWVWGSGKECNVYANTTVWTPVALVPRPDAPIISVIY